MTKTISILILALFVPTAFGDSAKSVLTTIDTYLGKQVFEKNFVSGDVIRFRLNEVRGSSRMGFETVAKTTLTPNGALFEVRSANQDQQDGTVLSTSQITLEQYESWSGNMVRALIQSIEARGFQLDMQIVDMPEVRVKVNNRVTRFSAVKITYTGNTSSGEKISGDIYVSNSLPGLAQIVSRREKQNDVEQFWSVLSYDRIPPRRQGPILQ